MEIGGLSLPLVFAAGVVSFLSPCVLPLVPGYLSTVSGVSFERISGREQGVTRRVIVSSGLFFLGFLVVFVGLGASASALGGLLDGNRVWLDRVAGALIIVFGLALLGVRALDRFGGWLQPLGQAARRRGGPVALGVAFAFCWTPCVGPILATILTLAGASGTLSTGVLLLLVYGLGLAVPFLVVGLGFARGLGGFRRLQRHYRAVQMAAGTLLVAMGVLLVSDRLYVVNVYAQRALRALGLDWWTSL